MKTSIWKFTVDRAGLESVTKDAQILPVLHSLGLTETVARVGGLDAEKDWDDMFSIGEQHMLTIARIFLARPAFVFLDRTGSSLPKSQIATILDMLTAQGIGVVIFAKNGESCLRYDSSLEIKRNGEWDIHHEPNANLHDDHADLRDLSC